MQSDVQSELTRYRKLDGLLGIVQRVLFTGVPIIGLLFILHVPSRLGIIFWEQQYIGLYLGLILATLYLTVPATKRRSQGYIPWYDLLFAVVGLSVGLYVAIFWESILYEISVITPARIVLGGAAILLVLEGIRRLLGWPLVIVVVMFILYARWAHLFPWVLSGSPTPWFRLINYLYLDTNSMITMVKIAATLAVAFILFGNILFGFGAAKVLMDGALRITGRTRGGSAKTAIVGSSLMGTLSGGAVTNVMITGPVTIPMMKAGGYLPYQAAAVEACASSGGQIMPPVMGIVAFLIAEFLEIPYATVALAGLVPAVLYYVALYTQIDLEAAKRGIRPLPHHELPPLGPVVKKAWCFVGPLAILVYTLFIRGLPAVTAGVVSGLASLVLLLLLRDNRQGLPLRLSNLLENTTKVLIDISVILAAAGFLIGTLAVSGLAFKMGLLLVTLSGGNVILLLIFAAAASYILGMGMPSVGAYALVATLVAPGLTMLGIAPLAAHLFIFYFAIVSNFTPPVAVAAFAAASLARADPVRTGFTAMKFGVLAYVVPFLFVFSPALLLDASSLAIALNIARTVAGVSVLGIALVGYLREKIYWIKRGILMLGATGLLFPPEVAQMGWLVNLAGIGVATATLVHELRKKGSP